MHSNNWGNPGTGPNRGRPSPARPNLAQSHPNVPYPYAQNRGQVAVNRLYQQGIRPSAVSLVPRGTALQRWEQQDPSVEPANAQLMGYAQRGPSQTDPTQLSDTHSNYDPNIGISFDIPAVSPVQNTGTYSSNQPSQPFSTWSMSEFSGTTVPAPTGGQAQPDMVNAPNTVVIPRLVTNNDDSRRKRPRAPSITLRDIHPDHEYYSLFNYPEYRPPTSVKGTAMGTRSLDHHSDLELNGSFASYLFQSDPIEYWILRDVAEKVPTKIREKEMAYYKQLGIDVPDDGTAEPDSKRKKINAMGEPSNSNDEDYKNSSKPKEKRPKTEKPSIPKGRRNWNDRFNKKFPNEPLPSSKPNWRPTVHVLLHAGKSNEGPQDFNSRILNALKRCDDDPQFLSLLIQKVESCRDSQHRLAYESESTEHSDVFQTGSFDSHSQRGAMSEGMPTDTSVHPRRVSRNPSVRSSQSYRQGHSRNPSGANSASQRITDYMPAQIQTGLQAFSFPSSPARASGSGNGHYLPPSQTQNGGLHGGDSHSDELTSFLSSQDHEASYSHPGTTVPETPGLMPPHVFRGGVDDGVSVSFPYAGSIAAEDIKSS
ncbi:hypothetical protein TWF788_008332 [Orbilia oligospora]|uniref:Uncharacterized protein n=1 Tax=Orbilia oligospora TaxID=2813651 RepID=A0A6G1MDV3_ORBOL|nr:hypothetical protein TWF788_008332 [Orbilia oligospora]KAF3201251.1 hypothetical protein TWF679_011471 [Orbilia oligospora]KAF3225755.1 hypothetical protein TWF191_005102 [Orbilia oligospora]KAF3254874.1 hypothetical protein TWF192_002957 [Orbilia oligospora]